MGAGHAHDHGHGHGHGHTHAHTTHARGRGPEDFGRAFAVGVGLQLAFVAGEVVAGITSRSLAIVADAGHNVSDVLALALAWGATVLARRGASKGRTYGLRSATILAALANAVALVFVNGAVAWAAVGRLHAPQPVATTTMILVALLGVAVNGFCAWLFARGSERDINVRAAFLHLLSDAVVAGGVAVTGVLIRLTGFVWLDAVAGLAVAVIVVASTWSLFRRALDLALHAVPPGIDEDRVRAWLAELPEVVEVHDLHIWGMSTRDVAMTAHLVVQQMPTHALACEIDRELRSHFGIHHVTIQLDPLGSRCALAAADAL
jgi:cobalt-zinc-cadmium efflux system protein